MAITTRRQNSGTDSEIGTVTTDRISDSNGYAKLASYIGGAAENAIFRGFRDLYAENLLYLQAEVVRLQQELKASQEISHNSKDEDQLKPARTVMGHGSGPELHQTSRLKKVLELQNALDVYYDSLFRYEKIVNMGRPHSRNLKDMLDWMFSGESPNVTLSGENGRFYKDRWEERQQPETRELVTLDRTSKDAFTSWIEYYVIDVYHYLVGQRIHASSPDSRHVPGFVHYDPEKIRQFARLFTAAFACTLPTASIFILHNVPDTTLRLVTVLIMSVAFAVAMVLMTSASAHDVFSATATFAAVLVVFVGTDSGSS